MILTIDIGNTTIRFCGLTPNSDNYDVSFSVRTDTVRSDDQSRYFDMIRSVLGKANVDIKSIDGAVICSVVPDITAPMQQSVKALIGNFAVEVNQSTAGLALDLSEPEKVGADRLADAVWAARCCKLPAVTVDMGTATTFNVIGKGGVFLGGAICAGISTGLNALCDRAAQLSKVQLKTPPHAIGKNTEECMLSGAIFGAAAMIDGLTARIEEELGCPVSLIMTGGLAKYAEPFVSHPHISEPDLLPKGMADVYSAVKQR